MKINQERGCRDYCVIFLTGGPNELLKETRSDLLILILSISCLLQTGFGEMTLSKNFNKRFTKEHTIALKCPYINTRKHSAGKNLMQWTGRQKHWHKKTRVDVRSTAGIDLQQKERIRFRHVKPSFGTRGETNFHKIHFWKEVNFAERIYFVFFHFCVFEWKYLLNSSSMKNR